MVKKGKTLTNTYLVVGILSIILSLITLWEYVRDYGYLDIAFIPIIAMGVIAGILFILAYKLVLNNKEYLGVVILGCFLGLIGSFWVIISWLGLWAGGFNIKADILIFIVNWILSIVYIVVLVMTAVLVKYEQPS